MPFTLSCIITAILLSIVGVTTADGCYGSGLRFGEIVDGDITDPIKNFCLDNHGGTFKQGGQAKGCVDTQKRKKTASLNVTIEFTSTPHESGSLNFTSDACEEVLLSVVEKCQQGGEGIIVNYGPVGASHLKKARHEGHSRVDHRGRTKSFQGRDAHQPFLTTEVSLIVQNSNTTIQRDGISETSRLLSSTAKCNDSIKTNAPLPETIKITTTLPITLTISAATHAGSIFPSTTTTTTTTTSTTAKRTTTITITPTSTSCDREGADYMGMLLPSAPPCTQISTQASSSITAMNEYFTAKIKMDPNDCGCAHC